MYEKTSTAGYQDRADTVRLLTAAFSADPLIRWLFPSESSRQRFLPDYFSAIFDHPKATAYLGGERVAASIWLTLRPGESPFPERDAESADLQLPSSTRLLSLGEELAQRHPTGHAHQYLACLGVSPYAQGTGIGSALLRHGGARTDALGIGTYLEASSARSRALYLRHGFADLGPPIELDHDGPTLWPMWRAPHTP
ncbi:acetyltransferase (GNAT) family protein [Tamaricihabitans halophyticus]|uniref:Acetyltransferase (GNAT) family protein n=2 Tax=Tamaricihabitans halophyticus TaxID=1262583 RepID=A0A4R2QU70_9PSEU|nr:acetyltransferase (GNAT) family protein [Tamaricihabitans halophyticus]